MGILDPPTQGQQRIIDLAAEGFALDQAWPIFDYIEGTLDQEGVDAAQLLATFPRVGRWNYSAVWWVGMGQMSKPTVEAEVELTIAGMYHSRHLRDLADLYLEFIQLMISLRRRSPPQRRVPRELEVRSADVEEMLRQRRRLPNEGLALLLYKAAQREPILGFAGALDPDGSWRKQIPRDVNLFADVRTVPEYVAMIERLTAMPERRTGWVAPSPLDLVASLDHLDAVWRARFGAGVFTYPSAERTAKLAFEVGSNEELDARLSALGEILRSTNGNVGRAVTKGPKLARASHETPLASLEDALVRSVDAASEHPVRAAVGDLERAIALRDAAQHTEAGSRAVAALDEFGIDHPIPDPGAAWAVISGRVIQALTSIREELSSTLPNRS